jgi:Spy/CpxP family protein refolding chaperone
MKKRWIAVLVVVLVAAVAIPIAYAGMNRRGGMGMHGMGMHGMHGEEGGHGFAFFGHLRALREKLDLSDAQVEQIKQIAADVHEKNASFRGSMKDDFHAVADVLIADPNAIDRAEEILSKNEAARREMRDNMLRGVSRALNVLTPEQRGKLAGIVAEHRERMNR